MDEQLVLAYLAGVLDSDGHISIIKHAPNRDFPNSTTFSEDVGACQIEDDALRLFHERWGGTLIQRTRKTSGNWRPVWYWRVGNIGASACVKTLRPYLRVKTRQADLLLRLRASKDRPRKETKTVRSGIRGTKVNPEVYAERLAVWTELRGLNSRPPNRIDD